MYLEIGKKLEGKSSEEQSAMYGREAQIGMFLEVFGILMC
jgi:hypothetical protein